jgi:hypothetical protein
MLSDEFSETAWRKTIRWSQAALGLHITRANESALPYKHFFGRAVRYYAVAAALWAARRRRTATRA